MPEVKQVALNEPTRGREISHQAERSFQALLDAAVDAIIVIDEEGNIEQFNLAAESMFGYKMAEIVGSNVRNLMPEPYRSGHDGYLERYLATGESRVIGVGREVEAVHRDGSVFPCEIAIGRVAEVEPPKFVGFVRDITRRKEAEEQVRRSEAELRLAQELANLGNYVVNLDGNSPDYFSPQLRRIFALPPEGPEVNRQEFFERWLHPADREQVTQAFHLLEEGLAPIDIEYRVRLGSGEMRHLHHIAQAIRDPETGFVKHIGTIHDVTDRRHAQDEARQLQERLTHFSRLSTMGEMAAGLAHEINQPLSAIATYAQASRRLISRPDADQEEVVAALEQINVQALRAGEVIRRLRGFVKNRDVTREPVDCGRLVKDLLTLAEPDARLHNLRLRVESDATLPTVHADPIQLQQVILNLVRNAIDAMDETEDRQREVTIHTGTTEDGQVEVIVSDHGSGLSPDASDNLFNPFFTTKATGTGLGLAISRSIIRAHGGRLWHTPNQERGARFHFTLPVAPATTGSDN
jgi:two-component system sensor kinase FixL